MMVFMDAGLDVKKKISFKKNLKLIKKYSNVEFESNPLLWLLARMKINIYDYISRGKNKKMFCSELIADFYKHVGVFKKKIPSNLYTFKDLRDEKCFKKGKMFKILSK